MNARGSRGWWAACLLGAAAVASLTASRNAGAQPPREAAAPPAAKAEAKPAAPGGDARLDQQINLAKDEVELLAAELDARKAQLQNGEQRLEQAKRWKAHYEGLLRDGKVTEDRVLAAVDDVLMMESHVLGERAGVKLAEVRLAQAKRRLAYGELPLSTPESRLGDIEGRMGVMSFKLDQLQHEVGRLRRELPREGHGGGR